jgi:hypothetical protein
MHHEGFRVELALPKPVRHWSLTTLREKLIKIGAKVTRHAKYVTFLLGGSRRDAELVRRDPQPHRAARPPAASCLPNACRERHGGAEKALDSGGGLLTAGGEALKSTLWGMAPAVGTQKPESWARKCRKIHGTLDAGGGARCYNKCDFEPEIGFRLSSCGKCRVA